MDDEIKKEIILEAIEIADNLIPIFKIDSQAWSVSYGGKQFHLAEREDYEKLDKYQSTIRTIWFDNIVFYIKDYPVVYYPIKALIGKGLSKNRKLVENAFSADYISIFIDTIIFNILNEGIEIVRENPLHVDMFDRFFHETVIYLPLDGIDISIDSYRLGKLVLTKLTRKKVELLCKDSNFPNYFGPERFEDVINKTCFEYKIFCETRKALDMAIKESEKVFDLIRYSILCIYPTSIGISVGLQGEVSSGSAKFLGTGYNQNFQLLFEKYDRYNFAITENFIKNMEALGVKKLSKILEKTDNKITSFEDTILHGLHWFADAQKQTELKNKFLSLMISLEIFLTPPQEDRDKDTITTSIADSSAIILRTEENARKNLKKKIYELYDKRSIIVHGKKVKKVNDLCKEDVEDLKVIIRDLIQWMVKHTHRVNSKDELLNKIKEYKISGDIFEP